MKKFKSIFLLLIIFASSLVANPVDLKGRDDHSGTTLLTLVSGDCELFDSPISNELSLNQNYKQMEKAYGLALAEVGDVNLATGVGENFVDIGDIERDSLGMEESEGATTTFKSELKDDPVAEVTEAGDESYNLNLMDTSALNLEKYLGGTRTTVGGSADKWSKPSVKPVIEHAFKFTLKNGSKIIVNRGSVSGRRVWNGRLGMFMINIKVTPKDTGVANVPAVMTEDATVQPI